MLVIKHSALKNMYGSGFTRIDSDVLGVVVAMGAEERNAKFLATRSLYQNFVHALRDGENIQSCFVRAEIATRLGIGDALVINNLANRAINNFDLGRKK